MRPVTSQPCLGKALPTARVEICQTQGPLPAPMLLVGTECFCASPLRVLPIGNVLQERYSSTSIKLGQGDHCFFYNR